MIKIIREGKPEVLKMLRDTRKFTCGFCDCIFEVDREDYSITPENPYVVKYSCKCPQCGMTVSNRCKLIYD